MTEVLGVILAGGRGQRLGGRIKANLEIDGVSLIERVVSAIKNQCSTIIVSSGQIPAHTLFLPSGLQTVSDLGDPNSGPVAGLAAAVQWAQSHFPSARFLLSVAVDTPFFPHNFVARAMPFFDANTDCMVGVEGTQPFPTNALWRLSAIADLPQIAQSGTWPNGLRNVVDDTKTKELMFNAKDPAGCFFNINTPEDILTAEMILTADNTDRKI